MVWICWTRKSQLRWDFPIRFHFFGGSMFNSGVNNMFLLNNKSNFKKIQLVNLTCSHQSPTSHTFMPFCFLPNVRFPTSQSSGGCGWFHIRPSKVHQFVAPWLTSPSRRIAPFFLGPRGEANLTDQNCLVVSFFLFSIIYGIICDNPSHWLIFFISRFLVG